MLKTSGKTYVFMRQPLTSLGKVALWGSSLATFAGVGGVIALTITNGSPSRDIVIDAILSMIITIFVISRVRFLQILAALLGILNLYFIFTEPFVTESLANPKGPNGGYGHFIGEIVLIGISFITFAANIGIVLQNREQKTPRWFRLVLGCVLGVVIGSSFIGALAQPVTATAATVTFTNGVPTIHLNPGSFSVPSVTVAKGSKLLLVDDTRELHVLSNGTWQQTTPIQKQEPGAPLVNNLTFNGNSVAIGPFAVAGTYHLLCMVHRGMNLTIIVQ